jgi:hypothetical protein
MGEENRTLMTNLEGAPRMAVKQLSQHPSEAGAGGRPMAQQGRRGLSRPELDPGRWAAERIVGFVADVTSAWT